MPDSRREDEELAPVAEAHVASYPFPAAVIVRAPRAPRPPTGLLAQIGEAPQPSAPPGVQKRSDGGDWEPPPSGTVKITPPSPYCPPTPPRTPPAAPEGGSSSRPGTPFSEHRPGTPPCP